jgi:hypothetical protein
VRAVSTALVKYLPNLDLFLALRGRMLSAARSTEKPTTRSTVLRVLKPPSVIKFSIVLVSKNA